MNAFDKLIDHLLLVTTGKEPYHFPKIRELAIGVINEARKDIGIDTSPIQYKGLL